MITVSVTWPDFKQFVEDRAIPVHHMNVGSDLLIFAIDDKITAKSKVSADSTEMEEYYTLYASQMNISMSDSDGIPLAREKITRKGWHAQPHFIELQTSNSASIVNSEDDGTDLGFTSVTLYDNTDTVTVDQALAVKTVLDWEPTHDYHLLGGTITQYDKPTQDVRVWVSAWPEAGLFGSSPTQFVQGGANLHLAPAEGIVIDGKTPKLLPYTPGVHTNKLRFTFTHPQAYTHKVLIQLKIFKPGT